jgi:hypothetical protein
MFSPTRFAFSCASKSASIFNCLSEFLKPVIDFCAETEIALKIIAQMVQIFFSWS